MILNPKIFETCTLELNNPLTDEQWDILEDVDFDHTEHIWFHTKHGKEVHFYKNAIPIEWLKKYAKKKEKLYIPYSTVIMRILEDWEKENGVEESTRNI